MELHILMKIAFNWFLNIVIDHHLLAFLGFNFRLSRQHSAKIMAAAISSPEEESLISTNFFNLLKNFNWKNTSRCEVVRSSRHVLVIFSPFSQIHEKINDREMCVGDSRGLNFLWQIDIYIKLIRRQKTISHKSQCIF